MTFQFFTKMYFSEAGGDDDEDESYVHPFQPPKGKKWTTYAF